MRRFTQASARSATPLRRRRRNRNATLSLAAATALIATVACLAICVAVALAAGSPTVSTGSATKIGDNSAVLGASVQPGGLHTTYDFQFGPTPALGSQSAAESAGSGTKATAVLTTITGLTPGTTYYYRVLASNSAGVAIGAIKTFHTAGNPPPGATTGAAESLTAHSVTLTGVVNPEDQATTYYFNYGLTSAYGLQTAPATLAAGTIPKTVTAAIPGLESGVMFHYQLIAVHSDAGPIAGADASFETFPSPAPKPGLTAFTTPRAIRGGPYTFLTGGRVVNRSATPASLACAGNAEISFLYRRRTVAKVLTPVQANCSYAGSVTLRRLPGRGPRGRVVSLTVSVRFSGDAYLAAASARRQTVVLG